MSESRPSASRVVVLARRFDSGVMMIDISHTRHRLVKGVREGKQLAAWDPFLCTRQNKAPWPISAAESIAHGKTMTSEDAKARAEEAAG